MFAAASIWDCGVGVGCVAKSGLAFGRGVALKLACTANPENRWGWRCIKGWRCMCLGMAVHVAGLAVHDDCPTSTANKRR